MRTAARWFKNRRIPLQTEDILIYGALASFAIMTALYLATIPTLFDSIAIKAGLMKPYASLENDLVVMLHEFFFGPVFLLADVVDGQVESDVYGHPHARALEFENLACGKV
ncbi:hypothetical protein TGAM01_v210490 [Trichoderma gamsii]|uniref:Uncharacterized protein n=1 Tax=Trichoderma gamsii TaxID=398673 RepID=A0A2P4Z8L5_9HYPO|nr:hypothetical protein TGAM01_v210490 [Trichoderma gamsii]PON20616.1 hypothetical protein TGAM01_v210490 [Trichoderma gamsii]